MAISGGFGGGGQAGGGAVRSKVDQLFLPRDQQVLVDVLLRQLAYVPFTLMRSWRTWLRLVTGLVRAPRWLLLLLLLLLRAHTRTHTHPHPPRDMSGGLVWCTQVTCSEAYQRERYRRHDLLDAIDALMSTARPRSRIKAKEHDVVRS